MYHIRTTTIVENRFYKLFKKFSCFSMIFKLKSGLLVFIYAKNAKNIIFLKDTAGV